MLSPPTADFPNCVVAPYHGPEFPSAFEANLLRQTGATQITLGTANGLLIAQSLGLESIGIADGAFSLPFQAHDILPTVLEKCAAASPAVSRIIASFVARIDPGPVRAFTAGAGGQALLWNSLPELAAHEQEDEFVVALIAAALPAADGIVFLRNADDLLHRKLLKI
jgi:hypothetical protein